VLICLYHLKVATVSDYWRRGIGELIAKSMEKVGNEGVITIVVSTLNNLACISNALYQSYRLRLSFDQTWRCRVKQDCHSFRFVLHTGSSANIFMFWGFKFDFTHSHIKVLYPPRLLMCSICTYLHFMYTTRDCYHQVFVFIISYAGRSFQCHIFSFGNLFLVIYILFMIHELPDRMAILSIMTLKLWKARS